MKCGIAESVLRLQHTLFFRTLLEALEDLLQGRQQLAAPLNELHGALFELLAA
jgi:hypothetical protein